MSDENQPSTPNGFQNEEEYAEAVTKEMLEEQKQLAEAMRLPQAPIDNIIKEVLPAGMHASKETRAIFSRAVSVFIICLGTAAHDSAVASKRKGILEKDVYSALKKMHLNIPEIMTLLNNFKANTEREKQEKRQNVKDTDGISDTNENESVPTLED